jgi:hypothetical protein
MGGVGSGLHGKQGRKKGGHNSAASCEAIRAGMVAMHLHRQTRPDACQGCGTVTGDLDWCALRDRETDEPGPRQWYCGTCLTGPVEPLDLETFVRSGTSNLGAAQIHHGMMSDHGHGPEGDRALNRRVG